MSTQALQLWLMRHGETEWSLSGAHTSRTDIPLTDRGKERAVRIGEHLGQQQFSLVLTSPLQRARETCRIAGLGDQAQIEPNLREWDYGIYEGRTTADIRKDEPNWSVWSHPMRDGESVEEVGKRAQIVIDRCVAAGGQIAIFSHAHMLRILAAVWLGQSAANGRHLVLTTGSLSKLGFERDERVIQLWNLPLEGD